jgi:hypothetical protein
VLERAGNAGESIALLEYLSLSALHAFETHLSSGLRVQPANQTFQAHGFCGDDLKLEAWPPRDVAPEEAQQDPNWHLNGRDTSE